MLKIVPCDKKNYMILQKCTGKENNTIGFLGLKTSITIIQDKMILKHFRRWDKPQIIPKKKWNSKACEYSSCSNFMIILDSLKIYNWLSCPGNCIFSLNFKNISSPVQVSCTRANLQKQLRDESFVSCQINNRRNNQIMRIFREWKWKEVWNEQSTK